MIDRLETQLSKEERDLRVLEAVIANQPIGISRIAEETGLDEHKARYSLRMLEDGGLIEPTPDGAVAADDLEDRVRRINDGIDRLVERVAGLKEIEF